MKKKKELKIFKHQKNSINLIHRVYLSFLDINNFSKASTKTKAVVKGGGRKPWKQKGTGHARAGSIRSPLWKGGGIIFGPNPIKKKIKLNKKEKQISFLFSFIKKFKYFFLIKEKDLISIIILNIRVILITFTLLIYFIKKNLLTLTRSWKLSSYKFFCLFFFKKFILLIQVNFKHLILSKIFLIPKSYFYIITSLIKKLILYII